MADNEMKITLSLDDKASLEAKKALKDIGDEGDKATKKINDGTKSLHDNFKEAGKQARDFKAVLFPITITVGLMAVAVNEWAKANTKTRDAMDAIGDSVKSLTSEIGSLLAPTIVAISSVIVDSTKHMVAFFEKVKLGYESLFLASTKFIQSNVAYFALLSTGVSKEFARTESLKMGAQAAEEMGAKFKEAMTQNIPLTDQSKRRIELFNQEFERSKILFIDGINTTQQYYNTLMELQDESIARNNLAAQKIQEIATLTSMVNSNQLMEAQQMHSEQMNLLKEYQANYTVAHQGMKTLTVSLSQSIRTNLSGALSDMIVGAKTAKEAFSQLGQALIKTIVDFMVQKVVAWVLEKTLLAGTVAASVVAGQAVAAAWRPAAIAVSLATLGSNSVPAAAGVLAVGAAMTAAGNFPGFGGGGPGKVSGATGSFAEGTSNVPADMFANIHRGETIVPANFADSIRSGELTLGGRGNVDGGINIYIYGAQMSTKGDVAALAEDLGFEIERKLRNARSNV